MTVRPAAPVFETPADLASLYAANADYVWRLLGRLGVHERDLEDITHDVFLVVHRKLSTFDATRAVRPWLAGIAVRVASDYRKSARVRRMKVTGEIPNEAAPTRGPLSELEASRKRQLVARALDKLPYDGRVVFVMHELEGHSVPEISTALGVPVNTLYTRLRTARRKFTDAVRALDGGDHGQ